MADRGVESEESTEEKTEVTETEEDRQGGNRRKQSQPGRGREGGERNREQGTD